jgi:hypothetical protein
MIVEGHPKHSHKFRMYSSIFWIRSSLNLNFLEQKLLTFAHNNTRLTHTFQVRPATIRYESAATIILLQPLAHHRMIRISTCNSSAVTSLHSAVGGVNPIVGHVWHW